MINKKIIFLVLPLMVLVIAPSIYFYTRYQSTAEQLKKSVPATAEDVNKIVEKIGKLMELPTGEEPTMATVADKTKLTGQKFFELAENGDKVVIYAKAQKAILYRPSTNKVVDITRVGGEPQVAGAETSTPSAMLTSVSTVAIFNGTNAAGLTGIFEKSVSGIEGVSIVAKKNTVRKDYARSLVVDINGKSTQVAKDLADLLKTNMVSNIPEGEATTSADVLVILGGDYVK